MSGTAARKARSNPDRWYGYPDRYTSNFSGPINRHRSYQTSTDTAQLKGAAQMKKKAKSTYKIKEDDTLTEAESLSKIKKACEGCTSDEACCAFVGLKKAGWTVNISDGVDHEGRKGIVISCTEPLNKTE